MGSPAVPSPYDAEPPAKGNGPDFSGPFRINNPIRGDGNHRSPLLVGLCPTTVTETRAKSSVLR